MRMKSVEISIEAIERDIKIFKERIEQAQEKLAGLPKTAGAYRDRNKLEVKRHALEQEVDHIRKLIQIAREGIEQRKGAAEKKHTSQSAIFLKGRRQSRRLKTV